MDDRLAQLERKLVTLETRVAGIRQRQAIETFGNDPSVQMRDHLDPPQLVLQAPFVQSFVHLGVNQAIPSAVWTTLLLDTVEFDLNGVFTAANRTFTANITAPHCMFGGVIFDSAAGNQRGVRAFVNGVVAYYGNVVPPCGGGGFTFVQVVRPLLLNSGDSFVIQAFQDSGAPLNAVADVSTFGGLSILK